jgi:hypothetical protein
MLDRVKNAPIYDDFVFEIMDPGAGVQREVRIAAQPGRQAAGPLRTHGVPQPPRPHFSSSITSVAVLSNSAMVNRSELPNELQFIP